MKNKEKLWKRAVSGYGIPVARSMCMSMTMRILLRLVVVCCVSLMTMAMAEESNDVVHPGPSRLLQLQTKAEERDDFARKNKELKGRVKDLRGSLDSTATQLQNTLQRTNPRRLQDLEKKALAYETVTTKLKNRDDEINDLEQKVSELTELNDQLRKDLERCKENNVNNENMKADLEASKQALENALEQVWLGNYEYYEVREGDTLAAIAANPTIYGDETKAGWIRQANQMHLSDPDDLKPGEVLIIPRFPPSGRYEF